MALLFLCGLGYERLRLVCHAQSFSSRSLNSFISCLEVTAKNSQRFRSSYLDKTGRPVLPSSSQSTPGESIVVASPRANREHQSLLISSHSQAPHAPQRERMLRSAMYTLNVAISFFLMLVIMVSSQTFALSVHSAHYATRPTTLTSSQQFSEGRSLDTFCIIQMPFQMLMITVAWRATSSIPVSMQVVHLHVLAMQTDEEHQTRKTREKKQRCVVASVTMLIKQVRSR